MPIRKLTGIPKMNVYVINRKNYLLLLITCYLSLFSSFSHRFFFPLLLTFLQDARPYYLHGVKNEFSSLFRIFRTGDHRIAGTFIYILCIFFLLVVDTASFLAAIFAVAVETLPAFVEVKSIQRKLAFALSAVVSGGVF